MQPTNPVHPTGHIFFSPNSLSLLTQTFRENTLYLLFLLCLYFLLLLTNCYILQFWHTETSHHQQTLTAKSRGNIFVFLLMSFTSSFLIFNIVKHLNPWKTPFSWSLWYHSFLGFLLCRLFVSSWSFIFYLWNMSVSHTSILSFYYFPFFYTLLQITHSYPCILLMCMRQ